MQMIKVLIRTYLKSSKSQNTGFTLIELLVVVIIIGVLSAIALPNFLGASAKAKQTEAKTTISSINTAQVAQRNEGNGFAKNMEALGLGLPSSTTNYQYGISVAADGLSATTTATAKDGALKGYAGGVVLYTTPNNNSAIASVMCEAVRPGTDQLATPSLLSEANTPEDAATCAEGQSKL